MKFSETNYKIYDVIDKYNNKSKRVLSFNEKLLEVLQYEIIKEANVKTVKTIDEILLLNSRGERLNVFKITDENVTLDDFFERITSARIFTEDKVNNFINFLKSSSNVSFVKTPISDYILGDNWLKGVERSIKKSFLSKASLSSYESNVFQSNNIEGTPVPFGLYKNENYTTKQEDKILKLHLNHYLNELGLKTIKDISKIKEGYVYNLSTIGDKYYNIEIFENFGLSQEQGNYYFSNNFQKMLMILLGFKEFVGVSEHLSGTFVEAIFYIAHLQKNEKVINKFRETLNNLVIEGDFFEFLNDIQFN